MSSPQGRILIVDDEAGIRELLSRLVQQEGYESQEAADGEEALAVIRREPPDVMLLDIRMPGLDGMEVLRQVRKLDPDLPVVMITSQGTVKDAVVALRAGAHDYLVKPFEHADVIRSMRSAMTNRGLRRAIQMLSDRTPEAAHLRDMMGASEVVSRICGDVARVAWSDFTVLITGETGTGKELVARAIHQSSGRPPAPFIPVDCGAIPETLFESELFGHEKGAFTGADRSKPGKFEMAAGGTLFLDEILNMPLASQAKLLRALQERTIYHVGGTKRIQVDCRVLVAANEDIEAAVAKHTFRKDLFFRLNEFTIRVPPLRERKQDIAFLAKRFLDLTNQELGKSVSGLTQRATELLLGFPWPGNVRQLRSTIRRAVLLADTVIDEEHLGLPRQSSPSIAEPESLLAPAKGLPLKQLVRRATVTVERAALLHTLAKTGWNKAKAARLLQIDYKTMHSKLKEHGLKSPGGREHDDEED
jgi:DNA-binding NtrC family response regulator